MSCPSNALFCSEPSDAPVSESKHCWLHLFEHGQYSIKVNGKMSQHSEHCGVRHNARNILLLLVPLYRCRLSISKVWAMKREIKWPVHECDVVIQLMESQPKLNYSRMMYKDVHKLKRMRHFNNVFHMLHKVYINTKMHSWIELSFKWLIKMISTSYFSGCTFNKYQDIKNFNIS